MKRTLIVMFALVLICGVALGQSNTANVSQDGNTFLADIEQIGKGNDGDIKQLGPVHGWSEYMNAFIYQQGEYNTAEIEQGGPNHGWSHRSLLADIEQIGNDNEAYIVQSGQYNPVYITQHGNDNESDVRQWQKGYVDIFQWGDDNNIWLDQHNGVFRGQTVDDPFEQRGDRNHVKGVDNQDGLTFNELKAAYQRGGSVFVGYQIGSDNIIGLYQNSGSGLVKQTGNENEALLYQNGTGLTSEIWQTGDDNTGHVKQTGPDHLGNITQTGGMNQAYIKQTP